MMACIEERLCAIGYQHYEVANYARPQKRSQHNQIYWHGGQYLGAGPGAHSFARLDWQRGWRWEGLRNPTDYITAWSSVLTKHQGIPEANDPTISFIETLEAKKLQSKRLFLGLHLSDGIDLNEPQR